jgi:hypothetical protein
VTAPRARLENSERTAPPPNRVEFSTPPLVSTSGSRPPCWTSATIASFGGGKRAAMRALPRHIVWFPAPTGPSSSSGKASMASTPGKEAALPQVVVGRQGRDPIAGPKLDIPIHGAKEGRSGRRFNPALGDHSIAVRFKLIAISVRGAFAVLHEMHAIGNQWNAPSLFWLDEVADRVQMGESPERLLAFPAAGENDWTSDAGKIGIEAKAPGVESAVRRQQPVQDGNAQGAGGG